MQNNQYTTHGEVVEEAQKILERTLRDIIPSDKLQEIEEKLAFHNKNRKGFLGDLVEEFVFGLDINSRSEADFHIAGVELKTTPLKAHPKKGYIAKERLVFSMINYKTIVHETWETSSFLKKNSVLLLMFYLWMKEKSILDYEFKFIHLLSLLEDCSVEDISQIRSDWEFIVSKIRRGEAHLLSEGDTYYLGACTKAANSSVVRDQAISRIPAKPRAFSLKQQYLNYLIQKELLGADVKKDSIFRKERRISNIEDAFKEKFHKFIGKSDIEIREIIGWKESTQAKNYKRLLVNKMLGVSSNKIEELEKANILLKVITLESTGTLKESLSFPAFDYKDIILQSWYDEENQTMADFHLMLETQKFLFVVFQKTKSGDDVVLKKIQFWNFPMEDIAEAKKVWEKTIDCIKENRYEDLPKVTQSKVAHVRPHGKNSKDTIETPQGTREMKKSFWLNAKYVQEALENA